MDPDIDTDTDTDMDFDTDEDTDRDTSGATGGDHAGTQARSLKGPRGCSQSPCRFCLILSGPYVTHPNIAYIFANVAPEWTRSGGFRPNPAPTMRNWEASRPRDGPSAAPGGVTVMTPERVWAKSDAPHDPKSHAQHRCPPRQDAARAAGGGSVAVAWRKLAHR